MSYTLRPLPTWPHEETKPRRQAQFRSPGRTVDGHYKPGTRIDWNQTLGELEYEVVALAKGRGQPDILIGVGLSEYDIRQDGAPRANARPMAHPGVEISFDSRYGRLTYATDVFTDWRDNVRAIAKGLEALRDLGRELVARHGGITEALRATHPDTGGPQASARDFGAVVAFKKIGADPR